MPSRVRAVSPVLLVDQFVWALALWPPWSGDVYRNHKMGVADPAFFSLAFLVVRGCEELKIQAM